MTKSLDYLVLTKAAGFRCGVTLPFQEIETTFADIGGLHNISVPADSVQPWMSASGGISRDWDRAVVSAIAEAMERYSASIAKFPIRKLAELDGEKIILPKEFALFSAEQYAALDFPWREAVLADAYFGEVYSVYDNQKFWVPQELIGLGTRSAQALAPSTSTGLAAHVDKFAGLLVAIQELLERDALTVYWLNSLGGREIPLTSQYSGPVHQKSGEVYCFDITQAWNPHPVIMVCGELRQRNKRRISMGVACRESYANAIDKAYLEWLQGAIFAGYHDLYHPDLEFAKTEDLRDFDQHAVYYTLYPRQWDKVPLLRKKTAYAPKREVTDGNQTVTAQLEGLLSRLLAAGIRIYYRDLTAPDVREAGLTVIRALSPELSLIHGDERAPFLGGRTRDVGWRYPDLAQQAKFPNEFPHPLG